MTRRLRFHPTLLILAAVAAGGMLGWLAPGLAVQARPLADAFVTAIRWLVGPIVFCTVAAGVAALRNGRQLGGLGLRAFLCFEFLTVAALLAGLAGAWLLQPGAGVLLPPSPSVGNPARVGVVDALARNGILQVLLLAVVCGAVLARLGERAAPAARLLGRASELLLVVAGWVLRAAPLAAFGAIAYTVGQHGVASIAPLLRLVAAIHVVTVVYGVVVLGAVARAAGFSLWRFGAYLKEELVLVLGTASSLAALPRLMEKLEALGCPAPLCRVLVPAGYSFNLCGSSIYLTLALGFLAQANGVHPDPGQVAAVLAVALVTSKAASGVPGSAFMALGATLAALPDIAPAGVLYLVGIERLLKCRPLANLLGNGVACVAVAAWTGRLDRARLAAALR